MAGSKYYKVWVWVQGTSTSWQEIRQHTDLVYEDGWGSVGSLALTAYDKGQFPLPWNASLSVRDLLVPGAIVRLTKRLYANGAEVTNPDTVIPNDPLIRDFYLLDPGADDKALFGGKASIYSLRCAGPGEAVKAATVAVTNSGVTIGSGGVAGYTASLTIYQNGTLRGTLDNCLRYYLNDPADGYNQRAGGTANQYIVKGTVDTQGTLVNIAVKAKNEQLWDHLFDLAMVGDTSTLFPFMVWVDFQVTGSGTARLFKPRVHLLRSNNATFAFPFGHLGFAVTDPFAGPTESRILDEKSELSSFLVSKDKERVLNKARVRYAGAGTQAPQGETAFVTNAASLTAYGMREVRTLDPWIQQDTDPGTGTSAGTSATANARCGTLVNTYNGIDAFTGAAVGIVAANCAAKTGELYNSAFNAVLGDVVGVRDRDGNVAARGKLLGFRYDQESEHVRYVIGLPPVRLQGTVDESRRRLKQRVNNLSVTQNAATTVTSAGNVVSSSTQTFDCVPSSGPYGAGGGLSATDTSTSISTDSFDYLVCEAQLVYGNVGGEPAFGDWEFKGELRRQDGAFLSVLVDPVHVSKARNMQRRILVGAAYLKRLGWTSVSGARITVTNTNTAIQTLSAANWTIDRVGTHTHSVTSSHDHNV